MAWPDLERRATMITMPTSESFLDGIMLVESSRRKANGKSFFVARTIATGIGGPFVSRANTNNVSVADPLLARLGAIVTVPLIASDCATCPIGLADSAGSAYAGIVAASNTPQTSRLHLNHCLPTMCNTPCL